MNPSPTAPALAEVLEASRRRLAEGGRPVLSVSSVDEAVAPLGEPGSYDAAWLSLPSTRELDVPDLGRRLAVVLRPGAPLVCSFPTGWPLPAVLTRVLRGTGDWTGPRDGDRLSSGGWRRAFGPEFSWHRTRALGLLIPSRPEGAWAERHALLLGALAAAEHVCGSWPVLRGLGERVLLEGVRR